MKRLSLAFALVALPGIVSAQSDLRTTTRAWVDGNRAAIVTELIELLSIPNVAADRPNIRLNAEHLRGMLQRRGLTSELLETTGNPLVYGELRVPGATRTLLLYAHYDGQPVEPSLWKQPDPFKPVLRTGRIDQGGRDIGAVSQAVRFEDDWRLYARSASDDKSPIVALCAALDALTASNLAPTSNLRVVLDGEEEASSPSLVPAIERYRDKLRADLMVIFDGPAFAQDLDRSGAAGSALAQDRDRFGAASPATVVFGARGIATFDLTVFGPKSGVHSGNYGNWIPNPAQRLASLLASMKNDEGRVTVAGFYEGIAPLTAAERAMLDAVPDSSAQVLKTFGVAAPERAFPKWQDALQVPTLNVRGLVSAHVGAGARTIIPDSATAAIDIRLVKETRGEDLVEKVKAHVRAQGYVLVDAEPDEAARAAHGKIARISVSETITNAFRTAPSDPQARAVVTAIERTYGTAPVRLRTLGGTVPIAPFIDALGFPAVIVPVVNFDNNQHEENENLRLGHLFDAIVTMAAILRM